MTAPKIFSAYYYSFQSTGVEAVDAILQKVAEAGKGYHHTDGWDNDDGGPSYVQQIQAAAQQAAAAFAASVAEREALRAALDASRQREAVAHQALDAMRTVIRARVPSAAATADAERLMDAALDNKDGVRMTGLCIVFDGPPGPSAGRFVEVETPTGESVRVGQWRQRDDGLWSLDLSGMFRAALGPPCITAAKAREAVAKGDDHD